MSLIFYEKPELESVGWLPRLPLEDLISFDQWGEESQDCEESLIQRIIVDRNFQRKE